MKTTPSSSLTRRKFLAATGAVTGAMAGHSLAQVASDPINQSPKSAASAKKSSAYSGPIMKLAEIFGPPESRLWRLVKQCGADHVVGTFLVVIHTTPEYSKARARGPWFFFTLAVSRDWNYRLERTLETPFFCL